MEDIEKKKLYNVLVREVHVSIMQIAAFSPAEAIKLVNDGDGEEMFLEYSHTLDQDTWTVEESSGG